MIVHCSDPLFIVSGTTASAFSKIGFIVQTHCSLFPERLLLIFQNSVEYSGVCQSQKNNPKILEYFEFTTSLASFLFNKKNSGGSWRFQNSASTPNLQGSKRHIQITVEHLR